MKILLKKHFVALTLIFVGLITVFVFKIPCLWRFLFNIPCPTCKMTRAMLALLHLNFREYCEYNIMALPVTLSVVGLIHIKAINRKPVKRFVLTVSIGVLLINAIYFVTGFIPNLSIWIKK